MHRKQLRQLQIAAKRAQRAQDVTDSHGNLLGRVYRTGIFYTLPTNLDVNRLFLANTRKVQATHGKGQLRLLLETIKLGR